MDKSETQQELEKIITKHFPESDIKLNTIFQDRETSIQFNPNTHSMCSVAWMNKNQYNIQIECFIFGNSKTFKVFKGDLPSNDSKEPDFEFLEKIIQNIVKFIVQ